MAEYRLYIDDSGTRDYDLLRNYTTSGRSRYFVYGAVLAAERDTSLLAARLADLKRAVFKTSDVEIKSNWLRMPEEREKRYRQPFGISDADLTHFVEGCYAIICGARITLLASIVDKVHMQETYATPWYAPTVAYEVLLQRVVQYFPHETVAVTIDDISGKTPKRNEYRTLVAQHHSKLKREGSKLLRNVASARISFVGLKEPLRFVNSAHSQLVQVADLVSYNVHRQFRSYGADWESPSPTTRTLPMYPYFERISEKFLCDDNKRVQGFGIVKFPLMQRVLWRIAEKKADDAAP